MNSPKQSDDEIEKALLEKIYKLGAKLDPNFLIAFNQVYAEMLAESTDIDKESKN